MSTRTRFRSRAALLLALLAQAGCVTNPPPRETSAQLETSLDARVPELLARYRIASVSVALIDNGKLVLERAYGEQSVGVPATTATLFNLASLTKPVSAEVLLRLISSGQLSLDEPMAALWTDPDVASDPRLAQLTLRTALSHQTGLPNWRGQSPNGKLAFTFTPGTAYGYSGEGYNYAARYAERKSGADFEELARRLVFRRLGMNNTSFTYRDWMRGRLAVPLDERGHWAQPQTEAPGQPNAANNLITTAGDYALFVASVMRGESLNRQLAAERLQPVRGPQPARACELAAKEACPRKSSVVFGWNRLDFEDGPVFMHTGSNGRAGGERTLAWFDPGRRRGIVILTSGTEGERLYREIAWIMDPGSRLARYLGSH